MTVAELIKELDCQRQEMNPVSFNYKCLVDNLNFWSSYSIQRRKYQKNGIIYEYHVVLIHNRPFIYTAGYGKTLPDALYDAINNIDVNNIKY